MTLLPTSVPAMDGTVQYLQQLQLLMSTITGSGSHQVQAITLSDVAQLIQTMQDRYGVEASLEEIIQVQVGIQLRAQVEQRRAARGQGGASSASLP